MLINKSCFRQIKFIRAWKIEINIKRTIFWGYRAGVYLDKGSHNVD